MMKTDRLTVQLVVIFIGVTCLMTIGGLIGLSFVGRAIPDPLTALGGAAIGALSSLLARTATESRSEGDSPRSLVENAQVYPTNNHTEAPARVSQSE